MGLNSASRFSLSRRCHAGPMSCGQPCGRDLSHAIDIIAMSQHEQETTQRGTMSHNTVEGILSHTSIGKLRDRRSSWFDGE